MGWDGSRWVGCPGDQVGGLRDHWHWQGRGSGLWRVNLYLDEGQSTRKYIHTSDSQLQPPAQDTRPPSAGTSPGGGCALCLRPASVYRDSPPDRRCPGHHTGPSRAGRPAAPAPRPPSPPRHALWEGALCTRESFETAAYASHRGFTCTACAPNGPCYAHATFTVRVNTPRRRRPTGRPRQRVGAAPWGLRTHGLGFAPGNTSSGAGDTGVRQRLGAVVANGARCILGPGPKEGARGKLAKPPGQGGDGSRRRR